MNTCFLIGRTTSDIELKSTQSNISFCNFTLAVNRQFKNESGETEADFIRILAWRKTSELAAQYVKKGHQIAVLGRIQTRSYEADNGTRYITEVVADSIQFLEAKQDNNYPQTDEEIDETFKHGNPTNPPKILTKSQVREEESKTNVDESSLPF